MIKHENVYYIKFILLWINGGTEVLRDIVTRGLKRRNVSLADFLQTNKKKICDSKQITNSQRDILYPLSPHVSDISKWDISLMSCIALNCMRDVLNETERFVVKKVRDMRYDVQIHSRNAEIETIKFTKIWNELLLVFELFSYPTSTKDNVKLNNLISRLSSDQLDIQAAIEELKLIAHGDEFIEQSLSQMVVDHSSGEEVMLVKETEQGEANVITIPSASATVVRTFKTLKQVTCVPEVGPADTFLTVLDSPTLLNPFSPIMSREFMKFVRHTTESPNVKEATEDNYMHLKAGRHTTESPNVKETTEDNYMHLKAGRHTTESPNVKETTEDNYMHLKAGRHTTESPNVKETTEDNYMHLKAGRHTTESPNVKETTEDNYMHLKAGRHTTESPNVKETTEDNYMHLKAGRHTTESPNVKETTEDNYMHLKAGRHTTESPNVKETTEDNYMHLKAGNDSKLLELDDDECLQHLSSSSTDDRNQHNKKEGNGESLGRHFHVKQEVRFLIKMGNLPEQRLLNELSTEFGRKSKIVKHICRKVCEHIKTLDQSILDVWAAYTLNDVNKVIFVVVVKENVRLEKAINYSFIKRVASQYSQEAEDVLHSKLNFPLDRDEQRKMSTAICNHATELMKKHKYLSIISESSVRSRNYGKDARDSLEIVKESCIALYVHTKHYIPIDEEPFEMFYDDVPVDVREGAFHLYGLTAKDVHEQIKIGCQIGNAPNDENPQGLAGCLGFFVDHPIYNLCGLTCAHVLLHPWGMKEVKKNGGILNWPDFSPHETVYQPGGAEASHAVGQIVQAIYEEGAAGKKCGIEVALFQIDRRQPISGEFPSLSNGRDAELLFDSGKSCGFSHVDAGSQVMKFGPATDKTIGALVDPTAMNISVKTPLLHGNYRITLCHQVHVKGIEQAADGTPLPFAAEGDSGSLVFTKDCNGELVCVGIVEGGTTFGTTVVTPIKPILQKLGVPNIKSFEKEKVLEKLGSIEKTLQEFATSNQEFKTSLIQEVATSNQEFKTSLIQEVATSNQEFKTSLIQEVATSNQEFKTSLIQEIKTLLEKKNDI